MPDSFTSFREFNQSLVMINPNFLNSQQLCSDIPKHLAEDKVLGLRVDSPDVSDLSKNIRVVIDSLLFITFGFDLLDRFIHLLFKVGEVLGFDDSSQAGVTFLLELSYLSLANCVFLLCGLC